MIIRTHYFKDSLFEKMKGGRVRMLVLSDRIPWGGLERGALCYTCIPPSPWKHRSLRRCHSATQPDLKECTPNWTPLRNLFPCVWLKAKGWVPQRHPSFFVQTRLSRKRFSRMTFQFQVPFFSPPHLLKSQPGCCGCCWRRTRALLLLLIGLLVLGLWAPVSATQEKEGIKGLATVLAVCRIKILGGLCTQLQCSRSSEIFIKKRQNMH